MNIITFAKKMLRSTINRVGFDLVRVTPNHPKTLSRFYSDKYPGWPLNLGCGSMHHLPGFINIDICSLPNGSDKIGFIQFYDLTQGLPFDSDSRMLIYSSHFFEHLSASDGMKIIKDAYRVLIRGGVLRIVIPNIPLSLESYVSNNITSLFESHPAANEIFKVLPRATDRILAMDCLNFAVYDTGGMHGHKCIYDLEGLRYSLEFAGFSTVVFSEFNPRTDLHWHKDFSIYVEATK
jgi:predicted SAM-dependent methyltransferase